MNTADLRAAFLIETLFAPGKVELVYTDADRAIIGSAVPTTGPFKLSAGCGIARGVFLRTPRIGRAEHRRQRRGGGGWKKIRDGKLDCLYVGRGSKDVSFTSKDAADPAAFYLLSYPAHAAYPTTLAHDERRDAGGTRHAPPTRIAERFTNTSTPAASRAASSVMGFTQLQEGAVWNTMPPHTHTRRSEVYIYFDLDPKRRVMHFMGTPQQTRHLVVADRQAVISPSWSIHCGCGTGAYTFCWGMGGENQAFDDMDPAPVDAVAVKRTVESLNVQSLNQSRNIRPIQTFNDSTI